MNRTTLRRPTWPRSGTCVRHAPSAPHILDELSHRIAENAPGALRRRMDVAYAEPETVGYAPAPGGDRAWRLTEGDAVAWCVVDADSQAALLEAVLGGPGAARPTSIERAIVAETVTRLFVRDGAPDPKFVECERERPLHGQWWRCNVDLTPRRGRAATLQLFTYREPEGPSNLLADDAIGALDLRDVPLFISAEFVPVPIELRDILAWAPGTIVRMPRGSLAAAALGVWPHLRFAGGRVGSIDDEAGQRWRALQLSTVQRGSAA